MIRGKKKRKKRKRVGNNPFGFFMMCPSLKRA